MDIEEDLNDFKEVDSWTDDEWLAVIDKFPPSTHIKEGIKYVRELRTAQQHSDTRDGS